MRLKRLKKPEIAPESPWEWLCLESSARPSGSAIPNGWIPRWVAESIGIDCTPLDRGAAIWYNKEQSQSLRDSRWFQTNEQFEA